RTAGVSVATCGSSGIWMGENVMEPGFRSGAHHHGPIETAIYVLSGSVRMRWGDRLEHSAEAVAGDYIFVPAHLVHQEINTSGSARAVGIIARGGQENLVVNVDLPEAASG
ncbi:MAG TPA: cupin domain-containing protein, partial [Dehalococcoidia bacterium]|nr:cupin domain-containing protein [Dehalococcoidia bacterium]